MEFYIFPHNGYGHLPASAADPIQHAGPVGKVAGRCRNLQFPAHNIIKALVVQHDGHFIQNRHGSVIQNAVRLYIAEQGYLLFHALLQFPVTPADDDIGHDALGLKLFDRVLGRLGFVFIGTADIGNKCYMNKQAVFPSDFQGNLPDRLQKRLSFDVSDGPAHFCDDHINIVPP